MLPVWTVASGFVVAIYNDGLANTIANLLVDLCEAQMWAAMVGTRFEIMCVRGSRDSIAIPDEVLEKGFISAFLAIALFEKGNTYAELIVDVRSWF